MSAKPWEEEWELAGTEVLPGGERDECAKFYGPRSAAYPRATLAHAAPNMARALLAHVRLCAGCDGTGITSIRGPGPEERQDAPCPACEDDRAALKKAGVLP